MLDPEQLELFPVFLPPEPEPEPPPWPRRAADASVYPEFSDGEGHGLARRGIS